MTDERQPAGNSLAPATSSPNGSGLLDGYPGPALILSPDADVVAANPRGAGVEALLKHNALPEIMTLLGRAHEGHTIAVGTVTLAGSKGDVVLEVTAAPWNDSGLLLLLARDLTMERNLRAALVESRQRYKDLVDVSSDFSWEVDAQGRFQFVSPKGAIGYRADQMVERAAVDFVIDPENYDPLPFLTRTPIENVEMWMRRADGRTACVVLSAVPLVDPAGAWTGARGSAKDVTEERAAEAELSRARRREQLLNYVVGTIRDEVDPTNMLNAAAQATHQALSADGCRIFRLVGKNKFAIAAESGVIEGVDDIQKAFNAEDTEGHVAEITIGRWNVLAATTHYRHAVNGAVTLWRDKSKQPWDDDQRLLVGAVAGQLGIANEQITNHERILNLSRTDGMTGLLNRRAFFEEDLPRRLARLQRNNQTAALYYVDMDNFKKVNDIRGHQAGDEAILELRDIMMEFSRPGDVIARLGGDEFAMWLDNIAPDVARKRADTLIENSKRLRKFSGMETHPLGISVGIATYDPTTNEGLDDLLARADAAMYDVKHHGKGGFRVAPPPGAALNLPPDAKKKTETKK